MLRYHEELSIETVPGASLFVVRQRSELSVIPLWARVLAAVLFAGCLLAWGVLVIPNGIGFIVYFVARQPLQVPCPRYGAAVPSGVGYCASCGFKVAPTCPRCGRGLSAEQAYCPHCGEALKA